MRETSEVIEREVRIAARPETVFAFLTEPARMVKWMGAMAVLEPRPGGTYRVVINDRDIAGGRYVEVVPNHRVVFTWGWEAPGHPVPPGSTTVEVTLTPDRDGTILRLVHRGLPAAARDIHNQGWGHYLARLAVAAVGGEPGPDPNARPEAHKA